MGQALIVDDHPVVRAGVRELLQTAFPSILMRESSGAEGAAKEICGEKWAFVILDINLPKQNGLDVIKETRRCCPDVPIIVFSLYPETQYAARALRAGAVAYLTKDREPHEIVEAVNLALAKGLLRHKMAARPILSDREIQVLAMFGKGMTRKEIAADLRINVKTVSTYKARLLQKLELHSFADLIRYASEEGLVE